MSLLKSLALAVTLAVSAAGVARADRLPEKKVSAPKGSSSSGSGTRRAASRS